MVTPWQLLAFKHLSPDQVLWVVRAVTRVSVTMSLDTMSCFINPPNCFLISQFNSKVIGQPGTKQHCLDTCHLRHKRELYLPPSYQRSSTATTPHLFTMAAPSKLASADDFEWHFSESNDNPIMPQAHSSATTTTEKGSSEAAEHGMCYSCHFLIVLTL
jgi:hypothetical protein